MRTFTAALLLCLAVSIGHCADPVVPTPPIKLPKTPPAAIKITGPTSGTVGYLVQLDIGEITGNDLKIACFPASKDWRAMKDLSGNTVIWFVPGKKAIPDGMTSQVYTFVLAYNQDNQTVLTAYPVTINQDSDSTPAPKPKPPAPNPDDPVTKTQLYQDLLAAYKVSPDATAKANLVTVLTTFRADIDKSNFTSNKDALADLHSVALKLLGEDGLRGVRDVVASYLTKTVGNSLSAYDKVKLSTSIDTVVATLSKVPD